MDQIVSYLSDLGYHGKTEKTVLEQAFSEGPPNMPFMHIIIWLSSELASLYELESHVSPVSDEEEVETRAIGFLVEVSSLLKELCCPIKRLTRGPIESRLIESDDKVLVIMYLCTELQAAKILAQKKPKKKDPAMQIELIESNTAKELKDMLISLRFGKPPDTITPRQLFTEVEKKLKSLSHPLSPKEVVGDLLFSGYLTEKQWFQLERLYQEIHQEYKARRNLLLTRLDVTVKSFCWADRLKSKSDEIMNIYNKKKSGLTVDPAVKISHILAAKADLAIIEKTSSASVRKNTTSAVNKVIIGSVPDRGGRPEEQQPPPPEVPSWQKNDSGSARGGGRPPAQYQKTQDPNPPKSTGYSRNYNDENSQVRSYNETHYKNENFNTGQTYTGGRNTDYNVPIYQPVQYCGQLGTPQFGFGGYLPAGDNFQQYGLQDGLNQQYMPRPNRGGYGSQRPRGGYVDRGQSRGRPPRRRGGRN